MSILVANIGTSDITVKVGDYYLPIGFDRQEPNLQEPDKNTPEGDLWHSRRDRLSKLFEAELGLHSKAKFREVSAALLSAYKTAPNSWHHRIAIGRIRGVIQTALSAGEPVLAYLVVTDQPKTERYGYPTDTVHAFDLIQAWLSRQNAALFSGEYPQLALQRSSIEFSAIDEDKLHEYYYALFGQIDPQNLVYLSVKGGTHQMQQALKVQALASNTRAQIFLSPKADIPGILAGRPSNCHRVSYWRYQQGQKYQTVRRLLSRWDFDGAAVLLSEWQVTLKALVTDEQPSLEQQQRVVASTIAGLQMAVAHLNLDLQAARNLQPLVPSLAPLIETFDPLENLYAQCKIYAELKQISHFLARLGSFYEVTQNQLVEALGGHRYMERGDRSYPKVSAALVKENAPELWTLIEKNFRYQDEETLNSYWVLKSRFDKLKYIKGLIKCRYGTLSAENAPSLDYWGKLNFWYGIRNQLVHGSQGINESRLEAVYHQRENKDQMACRYREILPTMQAMLIAIQQVQDADSPTDSQASSKPPDGLEYGLYGGIRKWAIAALK